MCHYFTLLKWPAAQDPQPGNVSCLEVLTDLMLSFQMYTPINQKNLKKKHGTASQFSWDDVEVVNYLPNPDQVRLLPPPLLTECHSAWLHTLDYLKPLVSLTFVSRTTGRSLAHLGYSNMLATWPSRPQLLSGDAVTRFLASIIKPGARKLKYRCVLPKHPRRSLPPCFGVFEIRCIN